MIETGIKIIGIAIILIGVILTLKKYRGNTDKEQLSAIIRSVKNGIYDNSLEDLNLSRINIIKLGTITNTEISDIVEVIDVKISNIKDK